MLNLNRAVKRPSTWSGKFWVRILELPLISSVLERILALFSIIFLFSERKKRSASLCFGGGGAQSAQGKALRRALANPHLTKSCHSRAVHGVRCSTIERMLMRANIVTQWLKLPPAMSTFHMDNICVRDARLLIQIPVNGLEKQWKVTQVFAAFISNVRRWIPTGCTNWDVNQGMKDCFSLCVSVSLLCFLR